MQRFIILSQTQKFYNSPKIADFYQNIAFSPQNAETYRFQIWFFFAFYKAINKVAKLAMKQSNY